MILSFDNLKNTIKNNIVMNADKNKEKDCFQLLANKNLINEINNNKNEIIFGIRGTGKTTLLKAFNYYINYKMPKYKRVASYYSELVSKMPNDIEMKDLSRTEASLKVVRYYLYELYQHIFDDFCKLESKEYNKVIFFRESYSKKELEEMFRSILELEQLILKGAPSIKQVEEKYQEYCAESRQRGAELSLEIGQNFKNLKNILPKIKVGIGKRIKRLNNSTYAEQIVHNFDIYEIRKKLNEIFNRSGLNKVFICIDEFYMIDKDMNNTIQPEVAQLLKELFFKDEIYCVKISSVYSESKMQMRQNNQRKGLEINNDIFSGPDLDAMHKDDDEAKKFFKNLLGNMIMLYNHEIIINNSTAHKLFSEQIISKLFQSEFVFERLVCGSQGVPRKFLVLLDNCLKQTLDKHITINTVVNEIVKDYNVDLTMTIDFSRAIMKAINDYVEKNKCRFFFIKKMDYKNHLFAIKELLEKEVIQLYIGVKLPRRVSTSYKLFTAHYGNYLGALGPEAFSEFLKSTTSSEILFPLIPIDIGERIEEFTLEIPKNAEMEFFCYNCRKHILIEDTKNMNCPYCNKPIEVHK